MNELKRCPFCGGEVAMNQDDEGYYVSCSGEGCVVMTNSYAEKEAIEKWNTRTPVDKVIERLEERIRILDNTSDINYPSVDVAIKETERIIKIIKEELM